MEWLIKRRKELNLSQRELADRLTEAGIKRTGATVGFWELGKTAMSFTPDVVSALARALDWSEMDVLIAAGFQINIDGIVVTPDIADVIQKLERLAEDRRQMVLNIFRYTCEQIETIEG